MTTEEIIEAGKMLSTKQKLEIDYDNLLNLKRDEADKSIEISISLFTGKVKIDNRTYLKNVIDAFIGNLIDELGNRIADMNEKLESL